MTESTVQVEIEGVMWTLVIDQFSQRTVVSPNGQTERIVYKCEISAVIE